MQVPVDAVPAGNPPGAQELHADDDDDVQAQGQAALQHVAAEEDVAMNVDGSDEEEGEDAGEDDEDDGIQVSGPPIEMADDEPEEESLIEESVAENLRFPREKEALREGVDVLNAMPIEDSRVERLNARIAWSSLAIFGIKLMCQIFTAHTKAFGLVLVLPPVTQWDRIDWLSIDSMLDDVAQRASKAAVLELSFLGAFARRDEDLPSIHASLTARLPLLLARKRWTAKFDRHNLS